MVTDPARPPPKGKPVCTVPVRLVGRALAVGVPNENPEEAQRREWHNILLTQAKMEIISSHS